jgi:hypothetical protein
MTTLIAIYLAVGFFSYWPLVWHHGIYEKVNGDQSIWPWMAAWAVWSVCWPYRYTMNAWYWWRAKK